MVEPSLPPSRVGAATVPDSILLTRQPILLKCLALAPPSLTLLSRETSRPSGGFPLRALGSEALLIYGGCPSRSRSYPLARGGPWLALRPVHPAPCRPCCCAFWQSISPFLSWCLGGRGGIPAIVSARRSSYRSAHHFVLPGGVPLPGTPSVATLGWPAPSRPAATGC